MRIFLLLFFNSIYLLELLRYMDPRRKSLLQGHINAITQPYMDILSLLTLIVSVTLYTHPLILSSPQCIKDMEREAKLSTQKTYNLHSLPECQLSVAKVCQLLGLIPETRDFLLS